MSGFSFSDLREEVSACTRCGLWENRTQTVFGEGPVPSPVVIVGEAPGAQEDAAGKPFVGRSGQFLTSLMEEAGLRREKVFITNMVKCRPPENRLPAKEELASCRPWLRAQLETLKPLLVLAVGNVPTRAFLGTKEGITTLRGRFFPCPWEGMNFTLLPIFHPSYLLRNRTTGEGTPINLTLEDFRDALIFVKKAIPGF